MPAQPLDAANVVVLVGELSGQPRRRQLPSGDELVEFDVTTRGESGTGSVPVAWFDAGAAADDLAAGTSVAVAGHVRRRFFRAGGATQSRTEVVATRVIVSGRAASVRRLKAHVAAAITAAPSP
jgi:single-strand DNA-binding protein